MTGLPQFNFPVFDTAKKELELLGYIVVSPADLDDPASREAALASPDGAPGSGSANGETWADFLKRDVKLIADEVDAVAVLPGWENSKGSKLETFVARLCRKPVIYLETLEPVDEFELLSAWASVLEVDIAMEPPPRHATAKITDPDAGWDKQ